MISFDEIIGQDQVCDHLRTAIREGQVSHAYLISGDDGSGKMMLAERFAAALMCDGPEPKPCGACIACMQSESHNHPDIVYVSHEKSMIRVDEIRDQVIGDIQIKPYSGSYKVYIIDDADKMNEQAQNALLKTLEEPPAYAVILLLAVNTGAFLPTILSRCVQLNMRPVETDLITEHLIGKAQIPDYFARLCAAFASGSIGKALRYASDDAFGQVRDSVLSLLKDLDHTYESDMMDIADSLSSDKQSSTIDDYFALMRLWYRDVLVLKTTNDTSRIIFSEELHSIREDARRRSLASLNRIFGALDTVREQLNANTYFPAVMQQLLTTLKQY